LRFIKEVRKMFMDDIHTRSQRFPTKEPRITKVVMGNEGPSGILIASRVYYEIDVNGRKILAVDWISALATVYDYDNDSFNT